MCCGGVGGNEGAVTLAVDGLDENIKTMVEFLEEYVKGEPPIKGNKGRCDVCKYKSCRYWGTTEEELPEWLKE